MLMRPVRPVPPARRRAASRSRLVILLHGLGADGNDLIGLAPYWAPLLPEAEFLSPNAPFPCDMAPYGYQWFSVAGPQPGRGAGRGARGRADPRRLYRRGTGQKRGLDDSDAALVGFSQGTMMSLFVGLRRERPLAGIVGYSGRLIAPELLAERIALAPAGAAGARHRRPAGAVRVDGAAEAALKAARRPGRDPDLRRDRAFDRPGGAASAAAFSSRSAQRGATP